VVYGGLRYDLTITELLAYSNHFSEENDNSKLLAMNTPQKGKKRGSKGLDYLEGSKEEAIEITQTLKQLAQDMDVELKIGANGTEKSFKSLSGKHKRLIHIASHGVCDTNANTDDLDAVLNRCGLYFSGADNKLFNETLPDWMDDGFLSASEIAEMDLQGLELVTLSACETGKGIVTGDGVFGLQRGLKMAGARSILMSLWKVDDRATSVLMTEFYRLWLGGMSMHDALESAKKKVRSTKGWESPEFWAAFILLDGDLMKE
jgi:CHAT domain-containing protein